MTIASVAVNTVIVLATALLIGREFFAEGAWAPRRGLKALRFFTQLSNLLCALSALAMILARVSGEVPLGVALFKYAGTAAVTVTLMTVLLFLGPTMGYGAMLKGANLYLHLLGPALALFSWLALERQPLGPWALPAGMLPVALYAVVYLWKVVLSPESRRWEDFYGFNRGGRWPLALGTMLAGALAVCLLIR